MTDKIISRLKHFFAWLKFYEGSRMNHKSKEKASLQVAGVFREWVYHTKIIRSLAFWNGNWHISGEQIPAVATMAMAFPMEEYLAWPGLVVGNLFYWHWATIVMRKQTTWLSPHTASSPSLRRMQLPFVPAALQIPFSLFQNAGGPAIAMGADHTVKKGLEWAYACGLGLG